MRKRERGKGKGKSEGEREEGTEKGKREGKRGRGKGKREEAREKGEEKRTTQNNLFQTTLPRLYFGYYCSLLSLIQLFLQLWIHYSAPGRYHSVQLVYSVQELVRKPGLCS